MDDKKVVGKKEIAMGERDNLIINSIPFVDKIRNRNLMGY